MSSNVFNNIGPQVSYTAPPVTAATQQAGTTVADAIAASPAQVPTQDTVQISTENKKEKKGFVKTVNETISNVKKFFASAKTYTVAGFKGIGKGVVAGGAVFGAGALIDKLKNKGVKHIPAIAVAAGLTALVSTVSTIWKASFDLNEQKSDIEHRYEGHKQ